MIAALRCAVHRSNVPARVPVAEMTAGTFSLNTSTSLARRPAPRGQIKNSVPETSFKYGFTQAEFLRVGCREERHCISSKKSVTLNVGRGGS